MHLFGVTANPDGAWTAQAARSLLMDLGGADELKVLLRHRGGPFTDTVDEIFAGAGVSQGCGTPVESPPAARVDSPGLAAHLV